MDALQREYPWTKAPLVAGAPMRLIALAPFATEISRAGGLGFIGAGSDVSGLEAVLQEVKQRQSEASNLKEVQDVLPVGIGFLIWAGPKLLEASLPLLAKYRPAAIWIFAPNTPEELIQWTQETRRVTDNQTKIWIQVGTVRDAVQAVKLCKPDVLVIQGTDAGGHGLEYCSGLVPLIPEVDDTISRLCEPEGIRKPLLVAAGGIMDARGTAAALTLGAAGVVMGTRYLAAPESNIKQGYRDAVLAASDGGITTQRTKLYDTLRGTTDWPVRYNGRAVLNESFQDAAKGMSLEENKRLHDEAMKTGDAGWGVTARLTTYAGTGVGLVREVKGAAEITEEVREGSLKLMKRLGGRL